jgi:hypothetical protein
MACTDYSMAYEAVLDAAFRDAIFCGFQTEIGGAAFALLVLGPVGLYLYGKSESTGMLLIMAIVTGGVALPYVAGVGINVIMVVALLVLGTAPVLYLYKIGRL